MEPLDHKDLAQGPRPGNNCYVTGVKHALLLGKMSCGRHLEYCSHVSEFRAYDSVMPVGQMSVISSGRAPYQESLSLAQSLVYKRLWENTGLL